MSSYVGLNVGGKIYRTSRTTLTGEPDSFFALLLSGRFPSEKDEQGNYLIDCDGEIFRHILNYMRYGKLVLPDGFNEHGLLKCQADFFQLEGLKLEIKSKECVGVILRDNDHDCFFHLERECLIRDPDSYFAKMIREDTFTPTDAHGNFIINHIYGNSIFTEIFRYLRSGDICKLLSSSSNLYYALEKARDWGLKVPGKIFKELKKVQSCQTPLWNTLCGIMFCFPPDDYFLFIHQELVPGTTFHLRSNNGHVIEFHPSLFSFSLQLFPFKLKDMPNSDKQDKVIINRIERTFSYPNNEEDLIEYISERTGAARTTRTELSIGCTKIEFRYDNRVRILESPI